MESGYFRIGFDAEALLYKLSNPSLILLYDSRVISDVSWLPNSISGYEASLLHSDYSGTSAADWIIRTRMGYAYVS